MIKYDTTKQKSVVASFINEIKLLTKAKNCLNLVISDCSIFETNNTDFQVINDFDWQGKVSEDETFDLIFCNLELSGTKIDYSFDSNKLNIPKNWAEILSAVKLLKLDGLGIFPLLTPFGFNSKKELENLLNLEGYFVNAIFNAPEGILRPTISLTPIFILISQKQVEQIFIAELLSEQQAKTVVKNYFTPKSAQGNLLNGMYIQPGSYRGFNQIKIQHQIEKLKTQYKEYNEYSIEELSTEINDLSRGKYFNDIENSIYIPKVSNSPVISNFSNIPSEKRHNYFQVVFGEKVINEYLQVFFRSTLGKLILQSLSCDRLMREKSDLKKALVPLPSIEHQNQILNTQRKLIKLKEAVDEFDNELALNPTSAISVLEQLDKMIEVLGTLTEEDKVRNFIRQGESKTIEFKETLSLDLKTQTREKHIELSALKTIVAFLNTEGGILLIGVNDNGVPVGINKEIDKFYKGSRDKFLLHVKNRIKERIGAQYYPHIDHKLINISGNIILFVECKKSDSPCYLDKLEFYVRTNPATDKLELPEALEYIKTHFKDNLRETYENLTSISKNKQNQ